MAMKTRSTRDEGAPKPEALQTYVAKSDGWAAGDRRHKGEEVQLTARAAAYEPLLKLKDTTAKAKSGEAAAT